MADISEKNGNGSRGYSGKIKRIRSLKIVHIPVLQKEVIQNLDPKPNENFIDCTLGFGGHTLAILEKNSPKGKILGIDADPEILQNTKYQILNTKYKNRIIFVCDNFTNLKEIVKREKFTKVCGILFDLGMSSWHMEGSGRGFSFLKSEPLDMRYDINNPLTAEKIVNYWSESEMEKILREYGEERFARIIAEKIINERKIYPIKSTSQLVKIIQKAIPFRYQRPRTRTFGSVQGRQKIHFATRTFQALRIAVNDELNNLKKVLPQAVEILNPQGRMVVISFHSLEDRIVKNFFKDRASMAELPKETRWKKRASPYESESKNIRSSLPFVATREGEEEGKTLFAQKASLRILTKKPISPQKEEIIINPRSRSAKLRAAIKIKQ